MRDKRKINNIYIHYRISDNGFKNKIKPSYITKYNCLKNALNVFVGDSVFFKVYIDSVIEDTDKLIHSLCDNRKNTEIIYLNIKNNGYSFRKVYEDACLLNDDDLVYFLEDDYLHINGSLEGLIDAAEWNYTDYITLYDHPDKYDNNPTAINPFCRDFGEMTRVFKTNTHHWKLTNSTTMTFAAFVDVLKRDKEIFWEHTKTGYPYDFDIFMELISQDKALSSPIPSYSTHGEIAFLAPFIDWKKISDSKRCAIVIPTYKEILDGLQKESFERAVNVFKGERNIIVIAPDNIDTSFYERYDVNIIKVRQEWLKSVKSYSNMMCSNEFYQLFVGYDYMLLYQTDCWVFEDRLDYFMNLDYDWYGAPWPHHKDGIGNGGFSLRKVSKMLEITDKYQYNGDSLLGNEDTWFCQTHKDDLNLCDLKTACNFSMEIITEKYLRNIDTYPMGLHGKAMPRFWDDKGVRFLEFKNRVLNKQ